MYNIRVYNIIHLNVEPTVSKDSYVLDIRNSGVFNNGIKVDNIGVYLSLQELVELRDKINLIIDNDDGRQDGCREENF